MITVKDNYLPAELFKKLQDYCYGNEFKIMKAGDKEFSVLETPLDIYKYLEIPGYDMFLSFIRDAYKGFDNELRCHPDNIILGNKTSLASVLYINEPENVTPNGTAFWKHHKHGSELTADVSNKEFDRLLTEDANDVEKWQKTDYVESEPNRLVTYSANLFHSKWPAEIEVGRRIVLVAFYKNSNP